MMGRPRIRLITAPPPQARARTGDNRVSASTRPSTVLKTKDNSVTSTVTTAPCNRMGRNSRACSMNWDALMKRFQIGDAQASDAPLLHDLGQGAIGLDGGNGLVEPGQGLGIAFAHHQADIVHIDGLVAVDQAHPLEG